VEHLSSPRKAIKRWYEVLQPGGHLIIIAPHRDLYEQKKMLPSYNPEHMRFWLPDEEDLPCTKSLEKEVLAAIPDADILSLRVLDEGYEPGTKDRMHPLGEYSIELIVKKGLPDAFGISRTTSFCGRNPCRDI
jgi:SAM-dependent methyltransferase